MDNNSARFNTASNFHMQGNENILRELSRECADVNDENFQEIKVEKMEFGTKAY
jgi:hypothetical protein